MCAACFLVLTLQHRVEVNRSVLSLGYEKMAKRRVYIADLCHQPIAKVSHPSEILALDESDNTLFTCKTIFGLCTLFVLAFLLSE